MTNAVIDKKTKLYNQTEAAGPIYTHIILCCCCFKENALEKMSAKTH